MRAWCAASARAASAASLPLLRGAAASAVGLREGRRFGFEAAGRPARDSGMTVDILQTSSVMRQLSSMGRSDTWPCQLDVGQLDDDRDELQRGFAGFSGRAPFTVSF